MSDWNKEFFSSPSSDGYGHVDGLRPNLAQAIKTDPFEAMLGLCRMMGLRYRVTEHDGKWQCSVGAQRFPADFHGQHTRERVFSVVNCTDRLRGISTAMSMAVGALWRDCETWRRMVSETAEYRAWFTDETAEAAAEKLPRNPESPCNEPGQAVE